jgi:SEC-C motif domain protein
MIMSQELCACDTRKPYSECCEPIIHGIKPAARAVDLMRARYTAYVKHEIDFIMQSLSPARLKDTDRKAPEEWSHQTQWQGLEIKSTEKGNSDDTSGSVEFIAKFREKDEDKIHHELSTFIKHQGAWVFEDGKPAPSKPVRNEGPKLGRNDPCHCGSGVKFKKCHGK